MASRPRKPSILRNFIKSKAKRAPDQMFMDLDLPLYSVWLILDLVPLSTGKWMSQLRVLMITSSLMKVVKRIVPLRMKRKESDTY